MDRLLTVTMVLSLALIVVVLIAVRRAHIRVEYSVSWLGAAVILLVLSSERWLLDGLAGVLGIGDPPLALLFATFGVFLLVFYRFSLILSHLKDANIALTQRLAILEYHVRSQQSAK